MKPHWIVGSILIGSLGILAVVVFLRLKRSFEARVITALLAVYVGVLLGLWATESKVMLTPGVDVSGDTKLALLAAVGGWMAQTLLTLNRLAIGKDMHEGVMAIPLKAVLGAFCGIVALVLAGLVRRPPSDLAAIVGLAGGAAGITVLDWVRPLSTPGARRGTYLS